MPRTTSSAPPPPTIDKLDGLSFSIKADYSMLANIPEEKTAPLVFFGAALLRKDSYKVPHKFVYTSTWPIVRVHLFAKVVLGNDQEALVIEVHDTDAFTGGVKAGKFVAVMPLPLKAYGFKSETDVLYLGMHELENVKSITRQPILDTPDLEGFVKSYARYKSYGFKTLDDIKAHLAGKYVQRVEHCVKASEKRTEAYIDTHAKGTASVQSSIRFSHGAVRTMHLKLFTCAASWPLNKPFEDRFTKIAILDAVAPACLLYTSPSPRDQRGSRMPSSA